VTMKKLLILLALAMLVLAGCVSDRSITAAVTADDEIKIGASLFLTGSDISFIADAMREGIVLATDELNANGGILGKQIKIIYEDDQFNLVKATTVAQKLIEVDDVSAGLVGVWNTAKATSTVFETNERPLIVLWDANEEIEKVGNHVFSIGFQTEAAGREMAEFLIKQNVKTAAIVYHEDDWSQLISLSFEKRFKDLGGQITIKESAAIDETDFRSIILKAKGADSLYAPVAANWDKFFKQVYEVGFDGIVTTGDGFTEDVINIIPRESEGVYTTQLFVQDALQYKLLAEKYKQKYNKEPELLIFTALGYDGVMVLAEAIKIAGSDDPKKISKAMYKVQNFEGAAGIVSINEKGSSNKLERIFQVRNGKMVLIQ